MNESIKSKEKNIDKLKNDTESLYDPEKIRPFRIISDEQLEYLATHNVWSSEESQKEFDKLNESENKTHVSKSHPFFKGTKTERQRESENVGIGSYSEGLSGLRNYIDFKKSIPHPSSKKLLEVEHYGPYGHGGDKVNKVGEALDDFDILKQSEREKMPILNFALFVPLRSLISHPYGGIMHKIDKGELFMADFEQAYLLFLENILEVAPRLLTLLARDPEWDIRELEKYISNKNIPNIQTAYGFAKNRDMQKPLIRFAIDTEGPPLPEEWKEQITIYIKVVADIYTAIREYLENKVKYEHLNQ